MRVTSQPLWTWPWADGSTWAEDQLWCVKLPRLVSGSLKMSTGLWVAGSGEDDDQDKSTTCQNLVQVHQATGCSNLQQVGWPDIYRVFIALADRDGSFRDRPYGLFRGPKIPVQVRSCSVWPGMCIKTNSYVSRLCISGPWLAFTLLPVHGHIEILCRV